VRHHFWQTSLAVTVLVLAFFALDPLGSEVANNRCTGVPAVRLFDPMPERVSTLVPDTGTMCNGAVRSRAMVAAFAAAVGFTVTIGLALAAIYGNKPNHTAAAAG